ncbi:MAG: 2,3-bisphosphoglycerate-independent phosphoglycerate mutase [Candidatus Niyogibacteria bacterium]|nr:MAG: 2,3-bisphosphoglycerate-independent phosphoglycerate mutase [Candidatus Niyogibacteria bacterium]
MTYKPVVLIILDGYGVNAKTSESPLRLAKRPNFEHLEKFYPFTTLQASGAAVGLPWGEEGNSEVGHLTIGAGRVIYTHLPRIIMAIRDGSFFENPSFKKAVSHVKKNNSRLHLIGLFSSGSVHAYIDHVYALLELARKNGLDELYLHLFTDGRDAPPQEASKLFAFLESRLAQNYPEAKIASVIGRRFAMDRDNQWELIEKTYNLLALDKGRPYENAPLYIEKSYKEGLTDEFIEPGFLAEAGRPAGRIQDNDAAVFFNYREDSARELTGAFIADGFDKFPRTKINNLFFVTMTQYDPAFKAEVAFSPLDIRLSLAKIIADAGLKQVHIAETEKYAHVTYFFNGGREKAFPGEDRILIPSVLTAHFDEFPRMSAEAVTDKVLESLEKYDFILVNFANADMVGHTGDFEATVKAVETLDEALGKIIPRVLELRGAVIVTGDHGNAEEKQYRITGEKRTKHTSNPVPFFIAIKDFESKKERSNEEILKKYNEVKGTLTDVAPTALELLGLAKPAEMTGISLADKMENIKDLTY